MKNTMNIIADRLLINAERTQSDNIAKTTVIKNKNTLIIGCKNVGKVQSLGIEFYKHIYEQENMIADQNNDQ